MQKKAKTENIDLIKDSRTGFEFFLSELFFDLKKEKWWRAWHAEAVFLLLQNLSIRKTAAALGKSKKQVETLKKNVKNFFKKNF